MLNKILNQVQHIAFIILILVSIYSCKNNINNVESRLTNTFRYNKLELKIPLKYRPDKLTINRWIDKHTGVSVNIEVEHSEISLSEYVKNAIIAIRKFYPDYKILEEKKLDVNIISVLSIATIQEIKLKFYMIVIKLEKSKIIVTIGGREKFFTKDIYDDFIKLTKAKNEGDK